MFQGSGILTTKALYIKVIIVLRIPTQIGTILFKTKNRAVFTKFLMAIL